MIQNLIALLDSGRSIIDQRLGNAKLLAGRVEYSIFVNQILQMHFDDGNLREREK